MLKLYVHPFSQNCQKVMAVADHLQVPYEKIEVDLLQGQQRQPEYLAKNPMGTVPLLEDDDGFVLRESNAIALYLNDKANGELMPKGQQGHLAQQWLQWQSRHLAPPTDTQRYERQLKPLMKQEADQTALEAAELQFHKQAKVLEQQLANQNYVLGEQLSVADFAIASSLNFAEAAQMPLQEYSEIKAWRERMAQIPAWKTQAQAAQQQP